MSDRNRGNKGGESIEKGYRPFPPKDKGRSVNGGYQPERSEGSGPTQRPTPPKKD